MAGRKLPEEILATRFPARWGIRFFQRFISPVDGAACTFRPSCSAYGMEAVKRHGILLGLPMAAERIMRNHQPENPARYPLSDFNGRYLYLDPVEANDFWWAAPP